MKKLQISFLALLLVAMCGSAWSGDKAAEDLTIVTGEHWMGADQDEKRAFLVGVGNVLEIEQAMAGENYAAMRGRSIVPVLLDGLSGMPIADIVVQLDKFYAANPDQKMRPVLEVLYIDMALPRMGS